jgi:hypothetical protein
MKTCFTSLSDRALLAALTRAAEDERRCRVHNSYQAELDYGRNFIERALRAG